MSTVLKNKRGHSLQTKYKIVIYGVSESMDVGVEHLVPM